MIACLELILVVLVEIGGQAALEMVADLLWSSIRNALGYEQKRPHFVLAVLGCLLLGGVVGLVSGFLLPDRFTPLVGISGVSLLFAPLATGLVMHSYGRWRRDRGSETSFLATFWGGALTAFAMALVRFTMIR